MHSKCQDNKTSTFDITGTVEMVHMFYINNNIVCLFLQVPVKYICGICRNPRHGRQSVLYSIDQDWLKEGRLPSTSSSTSGRLPAPPPRGSAALPPVSARESEFKKLSDLMSDLASLSTVLHSLRVKLSVARGAANPKVFMWSSPWESSSPNSPPPQSGNSISNI